MKFISRLALCVLFSNLAFSQTASFKELTNYLGQSPFSLDLYNLSESTKDGQSHINGIYNEAAALLNYTINDRWDTRWYNIHETEKQERETARNDWSYSEIRLRRKNVLTQRNSGINLNLEYRSIYYPDSQTRSKYGSIGSQQLRAVFSRSLTSRLSFSGYVRGQYYISNDYLGPERSQFQLRPLITIDYALNDKWNISADAYWSVTWAEGLYTSGKKTNGTSYLGGNIGYLLGKDVKVTGTIYGSPIDDYDGRILAKDWEDQITYGLNWDLSIF